MRSLAPPILVALAVAGCGAGPSLVVAPPPRQDPAPQPPADGVPADPLVRALLEQHNERRREHDLVSLALAPRLTAAARAHVEDMVAAGKIGHEGTDGSTPADRVRRTGYPYLRVGENVAAGWETVEAATDGWMESPEHRRNILGDYAEMGAARVVDDAGRPYWCVVFGTPIPQLDPADAADELLERINTLREDAGLAPIEANADLASIARRHARSMAEANSLRPKGDPPTAMLRDAEVPYRAAAFAAFSGRPDPASVVEALTEQGSSSADPLGDFDRIGVGYATADDGTPFWSLVFVGSRP